MLDNNQTMAVDESFWLNRRVLVTGHTGFKGSYLASWLSLLGADLVGFADAPAAPTGLFALAGLGHQVVSLTGDIRDRARVEQMVTSQAPEIVFHLASCRSACGGLKRPLDAFDTNTFGTLNLLHAARRTPALKAIVVATADTVYRPATAPRREDDALGGADPAAGSMACADIIAETFRQCYLLPQDGIGLATVRTGELIGGGDFDQQRLLPDLVRSLAAAGTPVLEQPTAPRPLLHVLDALSGLMQLAQALVRRPHGFARAWNLAPPERDVWPAARIADHVVARLGGRWQAAHTGERRLRLGLHRDGQGLQVAPAVRRLDGSAARHELGWRPLLDTRTALDWAIDGYQRLASAADGSFVLEQIERYARDRGRAVLPDETQPRATEQERNRRHAPLPA